MKTCSKCGESKPATGEYYYSKKVSKDGLMGYCIRCSNEISKQYKTSNKESVKKSNDDYREANCEYNKQYRKINKESIAECQRVYYLKNKQAISDRKRVFYQKNRKSSSYIIYQRPDAIACTKCGIISPLTTEYYSPRKVGRFGFKRVCRECGSEESKIYIASHKESIAERRRIYRISIAHRPRQYDKYREAKRRYARENKEKNNIYKQSRRSRKANLPHTLTTQQWEEIRQHFGYACAYCGTEGPLEQEHYVALSKFGEYSVSNIICSCKRCNSSKGDRSCHEWWIKQPYYSKQREDKVLKFLGYNTKGIQQLSLM